MNQIQTGKSPFLTKLLINLQKSDQKRLERQRGIWLSPGLLAFAIIAAISVAAFGIYSYLNSSTSVQVEGTNLVMITSGAKSLKSGGSYANVDNAALQRIKAFGNMTGAAPGGTVRNGWNGTVVVTGTASDLTIAYNSVPVASCDLFVTAAMETGEFAEPAPTCSNDEPSNLTFTAY